MNQNKLKHEDNSFYDTNRITLAINSQFRTNTNNLFTSNNEIFDVESSELIKVRIYLFKILISDCDFIQNYNSLKRKENINVDFSELPEKTKFDLLIKNFFYVIILWKKLKSEKENIFNEYLILKRENEDQIRKQEFIVNEQLEKFQQETDKYKCLYDESKSMHEFLNEKNVKIFKSC